MRLFYQIFINVYPLLIWLVAPFNEKAKKWILGRRESFSLLQEFAANNRQPVIWMHCSSLGEFEQGLPILEHIKLNYQQYAIVVSFFSPSGYEVRKNHPIANLICYLPMDSRSHASKWVQILKPCMAIFVKYEFWYHYLTVLKEQKITSILVSAIFRKNQVFFQWYGAFYRNLLAGFSTIMVQDQVSNDLLNSIGLGAITNIAGDTRFDRVITIANQAAPIPTLVEFIGSQPVFICGSTWTNDDKAISKFAQQYPAYKFVIAPHDISDKRIKECEQLYPNPILFTEWQHKRSDEKNASQTLIINNMGMLSSIYQYATVAFIGGGFDATGIHNTLEAAIYGVPVVFGPVYNKYLEAIELVEKGGAISVPTPEVLEVTFLMLLEEDKAKTIGLMAKNYVYDKAGAVEKIADFIQANRLLTN